MKYTAVSYCPVLQYPHSYIRIIYSKYDLQTPMDKPGKARGRIKEITLHLSANGP
ncbi:hypothetical protein [Agriterribacter sp.]|uniref:hypothetical protein n=1 Tax=Agriterribacter sp. TaxID=2821509 RepID=UPI002BE91E67|nr:hypothetical protein [Agriterribacter sp.]HTN07414.1 hypothetical protein [Agriterribacter sp.]